MLWVFSVPVITMGLFIWDRWRMVPLAPHCLTGHYPGGDAGPLSIFGLCQGGCALADSGVDHHATADTAVFPVLRCVCQFIQGAIGAYN